ncbi:hypothetical protein H0G37_RS26845, partial [Escherichia coli]
ENNRHPGGCLCHDGIKFLKFLTFPAIACSRYNDAALQFLWSIKQNSLKLVFIVISRRTVNAAGFFYPRQKNLNFFTFSVRLRGRYHSGALHCPVREKQFILVNLHRYFPQLR